MQSIEKSTLYIPCECAGGKRSCGYLMILKLDGDFEICFMKNKNIKHAKIGVYLHHNKGLKKLIKFLCN